MPSSATITSFYSFTALTTIRSSEVNTNFSTFRGHLLPIDPNTATAAATMTYDLGSVDHLWRGNFNQYLIMYGNTAGSVPTVPTSTAYSLYFKNDGSLYKKNSAGTEASMEPAAAVASGLVFPYAGNTAPSGYLKCDGSSVDKTTYANLFAVCSTTYGTADTTTSFKLPDLRGIFIRGDGTQTISAINYSGTLGTTQGDQMQGHVHSYQRGNYSTDFTAGVTRTGALSESASDAGSPATDGSNGTPRTGSETRPANLALLYIIKT